MIEKLFDFARIDIFTAADNHVFDASGDAVVAVFVFYTQVSGVQETVLVDDLGCGLRILIISFHGVVTAVAHFTLHAYRALFAGFRVDDFHFGMLKVASYGVAAYIERVVYSRGGHAGSGFRQAVNAGYFHVHLFLYLLHQLDGAERAGHDTRAQTGHIEQVEHRMVQLGYEHCGYAVECGASFFVDGCKHHQRVEAFHHDLCTAVGKAVHRGKHHAEAVEQGDATAEFVSGSEFHMLAGKETVVGDVVVGKHYPFRESGSARSVLHVYYVVATYPAFELIQTGVFHVVA